MERLKSLRVVAVIALAILATSAKAQFFATQNPSEATVIEAINAFNAAMGTPDSQIPHNILAGAQGIAIIPNTFRGAFVVGLQHGRGVLLTRDVNGQWQAPRFIEIAGGSFGYQIGVQATDLILVFRSPQSVNNVLRGTLKVGVDASAAAGPYGRQAAAGTDIGMSAEILSYSLSRGVFVGVSIDGSSITLDPTAEAVYYQPPGTLPASAMTLVQTIAAFSVAPTAVPGQVAAVPGVATPGGWVAAGSHAGDTEAARQQLAYYSTQLANNPMLDSNWQNYLKLPREVYTPNQVPNAQDMQQALQKYQDVAHNPGYAQLTTRPEFQQTLAGLQRMSDVRTASNASQLPPPPVR
jgi:lipid-binding SYLF domain-containing protein